MVQVLQNIQT